MTDVNLSIKLAAKTGNLSIKLAAKTGKIIFGFSDTLKSIKSGKAKAIILAANCPKKRREEIEYYSRLSEIPVILYDGSDADLGLVCGKTFRVSALTIRSEGDSDILKIKV